MALNVATQSALSVLQLFLCFGAESASGNVQCRAAWHIFHAYFYNTVLVVASTVIDDSSLTSGLGSYAVGCAAAHPVKLLREVLQSVSAVVASVFGSMIL